MHSHPSLPTNTHQHTQPPSPYAGTSPCVKLLTLYTQADAIVSTIALAQKSIDALIYLSTPPRPNQTPPHIRILNAIAAASFRGVAVRIVLPTPDLRRFLAPTNRDLVQKLALTNARIRYSPHHQLMHAKMLIIDSHITFHLTSNMTAAAFTTNTEINLQINCPFHSAKCANRFSEIWAQSKNRE